MTTGLKRNNFGEASLLSILLLCTVVTTSALAESGPGQKKSKNKKPTQPVVQLPSGPTGPVQPIPLDNIAAVPPQVTYQDNQLTIVAPNSTLADILRAVHKQTGAEIEIPSAPDRVVTRLGPGPARDVMADLLNGSRFNYILLGSPEDVNALSRIVLVAKSGVDVTPNLATSEPRPQPNGLPSQVVASPMPEESPEGNEAEAQEQEDNNADSAGEDNGDQAAEAEQQSPPQDQQGVKTPQQMLQEMQQRQMQLQQQQPPGQPPIPGSGMPPHPPQEN